MTEQRKFQAIKGVRDILPPESALWNRVEQTAREVFATYGYGEIRLPIFEQTQLFARSVGEETDIVSKEMYTFEDRPAGLEDIRIRLDLGKQISELEALFQSGRIPQSEFNQNALLRLRNTFERIRAITSSSTTSALEPFSSLEQLDAEIRPLMVECGAYLYSIRLGDAISLRPEATASVCRAYIEHGMHTLPGNVKLYYIGPMFRRERPQKGRYRQFYQIGAEVLGQSDAPAIDAEVIEMLMAFFERVGLRTAAILAANSESRQLEAGGTEGGTTLYINSIGCKECRPKYVAELKAALEKVRDKLGPDSQRRIETNPLRVLDSKLPEEQAVIETLPRITEHLCEACRTHYAELKKQLELRGVVYQENWRLVRGLDYYMRTTFEITAPGLGAQNAVCGGGRYDGLVELLGGPATKGIGFAIGTDRLMLSLQGAESKDAGWKPAVQELDVFVAWMGAASQPAAVKIARTLREAGCSVEVPAEEMKFKKSIGLADKLGARYALIIGENELKEGKYALKRLSDGVQEKVGAEELVEKVKRNA